MRDWLLFLGAGASLPEPSCRPLFKELAAGVLEGIGWTSAIADGVPVWMHPRYPHFRDPDVSAEALFGALRRFGFAFDDAVAACFVGFPPNAIHSLAAHVLLAGGTVWTTNLDVGVEDAVKARGQAPAVCCRRGADDRQFEAAGLVDIADCGPGSLVKLHGSATAPSTMAFTDLELMTPIRGEVASRLRELATGRKVIFYGYAGADADLAELIDSVLEVASETTWFEPARDVRDNARRAFRNAARIDFRPQLPSGSSHDFLGTPRALLAFCDQAGIDIDIDIDQRQQLTRSVTPPPVTVALDRPAGIANARLVERFGMPDQHRDAIVAARLDDALSQRIDTVRGHLRWALTQSVYSRSGHARRLISWAGHHKRALKSLRRGRIADYMISRHEAILLSDGDWRELGQFVDWAAERRLAADGAEHPVDLYYRAQVHRYKLRPEEAREDSRKAVRGLETARDPERLAGALFEHGCACVYTGDLDGALQAAFELQWRRGRFAIPRWRGWGAWLEAVTLCLSNQPDRASEAAARARMRFEADGRDDLLLDATNVDLLVTRLKMAHGDEGPNAELIQQADGPDLRLRYRDDRDLIIADIQIAQGHLEQAAERLRRVCREPSSPSAAAFADLGQAEIARLQGDADANDRFSELFARTAACGARWLQYQSALGLELAGHPEAAHTWRETQPHLPFAAQAERASDLRVGDPRVLWLLSI